MEHILRRSQARQGTWTIDTTDTRTKYEEKDEAEGGINNDRNKGRTQGAK